MRRVFFGAAALAAVALTVGFIGSAGAAKPPPTTASGCPNGGTYVADPNVGASATGTTTRTYTFNSWVPESPVNGVPGLVGYCVYASQAPTAVNPLATGDNGQQWKASKAGQTFSFLRPAGEKSNIGLDGTDTVMGTATFSDEVSGETILLHVSDAATCQALYGGDATTCYVLPSPKPGPVCDAADPDGFTAAYNNIPKDAVDCGPPSHAFEATQTKEFGNEVVVANGGGDLDKLTVLFNSYACEDFPAWFNSQCYTANPSDTFTHPITANIYEANADHTVGALLATVTETKTIPYRPSADTDKCGTTGQFFNPISGNCEYSKKVLLTFTFPSGQHPTLDTGDHVIWTVEYATSTNGLTPTDSSQCTVSAGCPYDSLNVGTKTFDNAPYAGSEADTHAAFINSTWNGIYCDDGLGGTGSLRVSTNPPTPCTNTEATNNYAPDAWLGYTPLATITLAY